MVIEARYALQAFICITAVLGMRQRYLSTTPGLDTGHPVNADVELASGGSKWTRPNCNAGSRLC